jgi:hypothetical protein
LCCQELSSPFQGSICGRTAAGPAGRCHLQISQRSRIFRWFNADFNGDIVGFFEQYAAIELKAGIAAERENIKVKYLDSDWSLNGE